jgi:hypothetical protein
MNAHDNKLLEQHALSLGVVYTNIEFKPDATFKERSRALEACSNLAKRHYQAALAAGILFKIKRSS